MNQPLKMTHSEAKSTEKCQKEQNSNKESNPNQPRSANLHTAFLLVLHIANLISCKNDPNKFHLEVKKGDQRYFEISSSSTDKTVKYSGPLVTALESTLNYVAIANNKFITVHSSKSTKKINDCAFFEVGEFRGSFFGQAIPNMWGMPQNLLLCLKILKKNEREKNLEKHKNEVKELQLWLSYMDLGYRKTIERKRSLVCKLPYLEIARIQNFIFTYKGGNSSPEIGVFVDKALQKGRFSTLITAYYLTYHKTNCILKKRELVFLEPYDRFEAEFKYKVTNNTIFFFKKSKIPPKGKQITPQPIFLYYFSSTWENPKGIRNGRKNLRSRKMIAEKSSIEMAEVQPGEVYLVIIGQSKETRVTVSRFAYNEEGEGILGQEKLMVLPGKLAEISDNLRPVLFMIHYTLEKDLLIFSQDVQHEELVIRYCRFRRGKKSSGQKTAPPRSTSSPGASPQPPKTGFKEFPNIEIDCLITSTKFDIVGKFKPMSFYMKESTHIGNLASFDFLDQEGLYAYTANIFYYYPKKVKEKQQEKEQDPIWIGCESSGTTTVTSSRQS